MRRFTLLLIALFLAASVRGWEGDDPKPKDSPSLADEAKALAGKAGEKWQLKPVKVKLNGKDVEVIPTLIFTSDKVGEFHGEVAVDIETKDGALIGNSTYFTLTEKDKKRFITIAGEPDVVLTYNLEGDKLKIGSEKKVKVTGAGEIDFSGEWTRKKK
jgi:hypothetical protein